MSSDQLGNLMTYTVFHIGAYISIGAAFVTAGTIRGESHPIFSFSLVCMLVAGACGGIIASNIPDYSTWNDFNGKSLGPWGMRLAKYSKLSTVEHAAFWLGVLVPAGKYLATGKI